ncbi:MAG: hypothetical protein ABI877_13565 [Gemmatimonadaceae bacterium]
MQTPKRPNEKTETDRIAEKRMEDEGGPPPDKPPASESEIAAAAERVRENPDGHTKRSRRKR